MKQASSTPSMKDLRRGLRQNQTKAEDVFWTELRGRRLGKAKFRRQHSFGYFIVDFYCFEHKLVIEVDGSIHNKPEVRISDAEREAVLCDLGLTIMRFTNDDILNELEKVLQKIRKNLI